VQEGPQQMLTAAQQYAIDQFAKGLLALDDDALIDTYHQALEDLRAARAEGSENLSRQPISIIPWQQSLLRMTAKPGCRRAY
jgi:hypothetical protein